MLPRFTNRASALSALCVAVLIPSISSAHATLAGVVKDSSGAVLPGVTVETSSAALIERVRTATSERANIAVDLLNLFNANTPTSYQQNYGNGTQYLQPLTILNPRFVRFNVPVDF
jgi:hypothetical protein